MLDLFELAAVEDLVIFSSDTDFSTIPAERNAAKPLIILFRLRAWRRASHEVAARTNLDTITEVLDTGAVVVLQDERLRIRRLPITRSTSTAGAAAGEVAPDGDMLDESIRFVDACTRSA